VFDAWILPSRVLDPSKKVQDLNCEVHDLLLEVVDLEYEVPDPKSGWTPPPQFNPRFPLQYQTDWSIHS